MSGLMVDYGPRYFGVFHEETSSFVDSLKHAINVKYEEIEIFEKDSLTLKRQRGGAARSSHNSQAVSAEEKDEKEEEDGQKVAKYQELLGERISVKWGSNL
jgi:hypothetical protein